MLIAVLLSLLCCGAVAAATIIRPAFLARLVYPATQSPWPCATGFRSQTSKITPPDTNQATYR
jgi:hypothetical protein